MIGSMPTPTVTFRLPPPLREAVQTLTDQRGITMSEMLIEAIGLWIVRESRKR
jgi:hypothetical protein